jgi:hypothetical protein
VSYNASAVENDNTTGSLVRFEKKILYFIKTTTTTLPLIVAVNSEVVGLAPNLKFDLLVKILQKWHRLLCHSRRPAQWSMLYLTFSAIVANVGPKMAFFLKTNDIIKFLQNKLSVD